MFYQFGRGMVLAAAVLLATLPVVAQQASRTWKDQSGQFEVEAKLVKQTSDSVQLLKSDGRVVTVPIRALSKADQDFLKQLAQKNPFAGGVPAGGTGSGAAKATSGDTSADGLASALANDAGLRELPVDGQVITTKYERPMPPVPADSAAAAPQFSKFAVFLGKLDAYVVLSDPILLNPQGSLLAVSTHRVGNASDPQTFGKVYLIETGVDRPRLAIDLDQTLLLKDHHLATGRSLAVVGVNSPSSRGGDLLLLDGLADGKPQLVARWRLPEWNKPGFKPKVEFARLLDKERAVVQINNTIYVANLATGQTSFVIEDVRGKPRLSGAGKYLALPTSGGCNLVDIDEGALLGKVEFPTTLTPEVHFSPSGERIALVAGNQYRVWNVVKGELEAEATVDKPCGKFFGWMGEQYLLTQLSGLIDLNFGMPLWYYSLPTGHQPLTMPGGAVVVEKVGDTAVLGLPIPHTPVAAVAKRLQGDDAELMLVRPGTEVALQVESIPGVDIDAIRAGLAEAVTRAGWRINDRAPIQLRAKIGRGEQQELHFRSIGQSIFARGETATIRPYTASLEVVHAGKTLWARSSANMVPSFLRLERGESLQEAVTKYERADPEYFKRLTLPPKILRPEIRKSVGRSYLSNGNWKDFFPGR